MDADEFIRKWKRSELSERAAAHQHMLDLCELLGHDKPAEADATGEKFTFEKLTTKHSGGVGYADVWYRGKFAWEYKGHHRDLDDAYDQLLEYREGLENPPLLITSDMKTIVIRTNFTGTPTEVHEIRLEEMPEKLEILRAAFWEPDRLKPGRTIQAITAEAAERIGDIAQSMRERGLDPREVAHFLDRIVFCMFADDIGLLPDKLFSRLLEKTRDEPDRFAKEAAQLFDTMATGGTFAMEKISHFNGDLFAGGPVLELTTLELDRVYMAAQQDWRAVDPSIFGTLFERGMDPDKRSQIGAHYTGRQDIETLIEPVVMWPLRREWESIQETVENLLSTGRKDGKPRKKALTEAQQGKALDEARAIVERFRRRLTRIKVLDPACGSGNFLYVTLQKLKDLEKEVIVFLRDPLDTSATPMVGPRQLYGLEVSPYAYDLAQMVVWIGYLQWVRANGFGMPAEPLLKPMEHNFKCMDAILDLSDPEELKEPEWPKVDYIVGNPPFLGDKLMRGALGDDYVDKLRALYEGRIPGQSDLCCYWFEKARAQIAGGQCDRAGLLATQGIRGEANRQVLRRIKETGEIFFAVSDRAWILDGAAVHVAMVGFDDGQQERRTLDGKRVQEIHSNLAGYEIDITEATKLPDHGDLGFIGTTKKAPLDIDEELAIGMLGCPNPSGLPNSDVILPYLNGRDVLQVNQRRFIIDFPPRMSFTQAAQYEAPFEYVKREVLPQRRNHRERVQREYWWRLARPCPDLMEAMSNAERVCVTPVVSKHRVFVWLSPPVNPDHKLLVLPYAGDYLFGLLQSAVHETWARAQGTQVRDRGSGFQYTPTTCFQTFPFPWPPGQEPDDSPLVNAVGDAARELNELRENWLNPPDWTTTEVLEFPGSVDGPWARYVHDPNEDGIGTVRYPRVVDNGKMPSQLKRRTLTNLYNERPTWLENAHRALDEAVFAAYSAATGDPAWTPEMTDEDILEQLLSLNLQRAEQTR